MGLFSFLSPKQENGNSTPILVDIHSHLLPGIDDGVKSFEESIEIITAFQKLGYKKLVTTPHINSDLYRNTPSIIRDKLDELKHKLVLSNLDIKVEAAAEYYLDENFMKSLDKSGELLTIGENYVLFETSYLSEPLHLSEVIFNIKAAGYWPILAHPERYTYLYSDFSKFQQIYDYGISFQVNINSLGGYYSKMAEHFCKELIKNEMVQFVGSDCHGMRHIDALLKTRQNKYYQKLITLPLLNNTLL